MLLQSIRSGVDYSGHALSLRLQKDQIQKKRGEDTDVSRIGRRQINHPPVDIIFLGFFQGRFRRLSRQAHLLVDRKGHHAPEK